MSTLQDRLHRIKENFLKQAPEAAVAAIDRSTRELRESGLLSRAPGVGSPAPHFELTNYDGETVKSKDLIQKGPLVMTFYRGFW